MVDEQTGTGSLAVKIVHNDGGKEREMILVHKFDGGKTPPELDAEVRAILKKAILDGKIPAEIEGRLIDEFRQSYFRVFYS